MSEIWRGEHVLVSGSRFSKTQCLDPPNRRDAISWVKGAVRRVAHAHYDTYVNIKPDSRPDGTAIRDHARVRVLHAIHTHAVLDVMAMAEAMDDAVAVIEDAPQTVSPSEILPAASRCSSLSLVPCRISTRP